MSRYKCLILGASGLVGQRLQQRLANHPMFEIGAVAGSQATLGRPLSSIPWRLDEARPIIESQTVLDANSPNLAKQCQNLGITVAFSALPTSVATVVEKQLAEAGIMVFSNASTYRRVTGIPMIIPEINAQHYAESMHYCATNCTLIPLAIPLNQISKITKINSVRMRSEQALSGAGWELLTDPQALAGHVNPHIDGEADKTAAELLHVMGEASLTNHLPADFPIDISCQRIARRDGHQVFVDVQVEGEVLVTDIIKAFEASNEFRTLPSGPVKAIHVVKEIHPEKHLWSNGIEFDNNPNPTTDLKAGMAVVVGGIAVRGNTISFTAFSHNTVRGAAGGVVYLAEFVLANKS